MSDDFKVRCVGCRELVDTWTVLPPSSGYEGARCCGCWAEEARKARNAAREPLATALVDEIARRLSSP